MTHRLAFIALVSVALGSSCGDDDERRSYEVSCDAACDRANMCNSNVDVATCAMDCKEDTAAIGPQLSGSFLAELDTCVAEANCVQLALMPALQGCLREAAAQLAPSAAAQQLCDAVDESLETCLGIALGAPGCLDAVKIFSDSALIEARACHAKSCNERTACVQNALGTNPVPMMTSP